MKWRQITLLVLGLAVLLSITRASEAGEDGIIHSQGPVLLLKAGGYDALTFVRPTVDTAGERAVATATFNVTYSGFTPEAQAAFQYAVDIWASLITSAVPINVTASWMALPSGTLGSASAGAAANFPGTPLRNTWYPYALAESLAGNNLNQTGADITANFNSTYPNWYYGTDGNTPSGQFDLVTVVLHELGHGLGFAGSMRYGSQCGSPLAIACWGYGSYPYIYDRFTQDLAGNYLINTSVYPNYSTQLAAAVTSDNNFTVAPDSIIANDGNRPQLYAPATWAYGSSYAHLSESTYPAGNAHSLMTPLLGMAEAVHDPGQITLCLFQDMGWTAVCNPESTWDGGGSTNNWSDPGNWSRDIVPAAYTHVNFDSSHTGTTTIDAAFPGQLRSLTIAPGYSGTINQDAAVTIEGDYNQGDGTFNQAADLTVQGDFNQSGGTYNGDGTLRLAGSSQAQPGRNPSLAASQVLAMQPGSFLNDLEIGGGSSTTAVTPGSDLDINGDLIIRSGSLLNGGSQTIAIAGDWLDEGFGFNPETSTVIFDGVHQTASKPVTTLTVLSEDFSAFDELPPPSCNFFFTPPAGWLAESAGDSNAEWLFGDCDQSNPNIAPYTAGHARRWPGSLPGVEVDAWLLSPAVDLLPGVDYELTFNYGVSSAADPSDFSAYYGTAQNAAAMTGQILEILGAANTSWQTAGQTFTVSSGGSYHVGLRNYDGAYNSADGGLDDISLTGHQDLAFYNLQVNSSGALVPDTNLVIQNDLAVAAGGLLDLGPHEATVEGNVANDGTMRQSKGVPASSTTSFLHITDSAAADKYRGLDITPDAAMGSTTVEIMGNQGVCSAQPSDPSLTGRCFDISPQTAVSATLRLWYTEAERNGQDASALVVWHYGVDWQQAGTNPTRSEASPACTSGPFCWVQVEAVSAYSPFVPGSANSPTAIRLARQTVDDTTPADHTDLLILVFALAGLTIWFLVHRQRTKKMDFE